jgi:hypothetical protein
MSSWQTRRFIGACVALTAAVLFLLSLVLPLFVGSLSARNVNLKMDITAWGFKTDAPTQVGAVPVNAYPLVFATVAVFAATIVAFVAARTNAGPANRRAAWVSLGFAAALGVGVTATVAPQVTSWLASFRSTGVTPANAESAVGLGFWLLVAGTVLVVAAAVHAALPVREREIETPPYGFPMPMPAQDIQPGQDAQPLAAPAQDAEPVPAPAQDAESRPANVDPHGTGGSA